MATRPDRVNNKVNNTGRGRDTVVDWLESEIDSLLRQRGTVNGVFSYDFTIAVGDHEFDALRRIYTNAGWVVSALMNAVKIPGTDGFHYEYMRLIMSPMSPMPTTDDDDDDCDLNLKLTAAGRKFLASNHCGITSQPDIGPQLTPSQQTDQAAEHRTAPAKPIPDCPPPISRGQVAALAMQSLIVAQSSRSHRDWVTESGTISSVVKAAVAYADALIDALDTY